MTSYLNIWNRIYQNYSMNIWIHTGSKPGEFYSYLLRREIVVPEECFKNPDSWDIFALLHEIGHIQTNTKNMKRCEEEYYATQWAIKEAKRIGFEYPNNILDCYQKYILNWRERGINRGAKSIPSIKELTLIA